MTLPSAGDPSIARRKLKPGTWRRIASYARPYRRQLVIFLLLTAANSATTVVGPLLLGSIVDAGIARRDTVVVLVLAGALAAAGVLGVLITLAQQWLSARIGQGLTYDLRRQVFQHVQRQPVAFFTRAQTGSLVSRLNGDVSGAQRAITSTLPNVLSNTISLGLILAVMFSMSWMATAAALVLSPAFLLPARRVSQRMQTVTRDGMQLQAELGSRMTERFNVAGAMFVKLYGHSRDEDAAFAATAARARDNGVLMSMYGRTLFLAMSLVASLATAALYGLGGSLVIRGTFPLGTLVALTALITRLYGPIQALSTVQVDVMTTLVSFERVFEVLDLKPIVTDNPGAVALPAGDRGRGVRSIEFVHVWFRYPSASEVSLASLESIASPAAERMSQSSHAIRDVSFRVKPGCLTALVGPSGAGKTTITHLVARLYDVNQGAVLIDGHDVRDLTMDSLHSAIGVVSQDPYLFHDTLRGNLTYASPAATEADLIEACRAAQIWHLIASLPDGLDTVVGDRGFRLSGGEKQRVAIARLLLKAPDIVVLDEATAHLDSESEAAVQRALKTSLAGRTSLVIAHRLSTVIEADQILVIDKGSVLERGRHHELLAANGLYTDLYRTQFAHQMIRPAQPARAGLAAHRRGPVNDRPADARSVAAGHPVLAQGSQYRARHRRAAGA